MSTTALTQVALRTEDDLFVARQLGRECAVGLGLDRLDALRVATAISELGREIVSSGGGIVSLDVRAGMLQVRLESDLPPEQWPAAVTAVSRLVDDQAGYDAGRGVGLILEKAIPAPIPGTAVLDRLRRSLLAQLPSSPAEELREQNRDLLNALEEVRAQRRELEVVNNELEETNRGVMALYAELSAELDRTNQGVVALYAEIDDKNLQLRQASEAKTRFLRSISHELRTPVNSILGLTGLLLDPHQTDRLTPEHTEQVQYVRTSAGDLQRLVEELLDLARAESGRLEPTPVPTSVPALLGELRAVIEPLLRPDVTLRLEVDGIDMIDTDPDLLRHVLRNLLSNAAKFTSAGSVVLGARAQAGDVLFEVRDTGVGIAEDDLPHIFEEFYQATSPLHASAKGTGLGLPFAQVVATALGGRIEVSSVVGEGSCFSLWLPHGGGHA
ncbi:sensor histidine kinase [Nocardioides sp. BP30]|uniref:ATP-binding protein n=1 Tax=Nocardioides sp. BP30 TaxID=3036374 RepID=UPI002469397A|nr:sensor histidine kinase [Nocardioides sp. BP30]WGL50358.1 sensor histidine kinase [Nocardioides sp. BP30]